MTHEQHHEKPVFVCVCGGGGGGGRAGEAVKTQTAYWAREIS